MNLVDLKLIIKENVLDNLDHKFLDKDVPFFQTRVRYIMYLRIMTSNSIQ